MIHFIGKGNEKLIHPDIVHSNIQLAIEYLSKKNVLGIDIETTRKYSDKRHDNDVYQGGLDPYLSKVIMLQIGDVENRFVIDTRVVDISPLLPVLNSKDITFVGHNLKFEAKHLRHNYGVTFHNIWDTMLVDQNIYNGLRISFSLASLCERYLGIKKVEDINLFSDMDSDQVYINKSIREEFLIIGEKPFTVDQITYGSDDIVYPLQIKAIQEKKTEFAVVNKLENDFCLCIADMEIKGMPFDPMKWIEVYEHSKVVYNKRLKAINEYAEKYHGKFFKNLDLFSSTPICNIMWSSSDQVIDFFKFLGNCPKEKSKETGQIDYTVGAKALLKLLDKQHKDKFARDSDIEITDFQSFIVGYLLFKKAEQAVTTFGKEWLKNVHPITGRIHSNYKQIMNTGRISSNKPKELGAVKVILQYNRMNCGKPFTGNPQPSLQSRKVQRLLGVIAI